MKGEVIGRGSFTTAYKHGKNKVLLVSSDPIKECMSMGWFPNSRLFPKVERISYAGENGKSTYVMKRYEKVTAPKQQLKPEHYKIYQTLRTISVLYWSPHEDKFTKTVKDSSLPKHIKQHLCDAWDACWNYGKPCFEISPRNIAVSNGNLILLDVFFNVEALRIAQRR